MKWSNCLIIIPNSSLVNQPVFSYTCMCTWKVGGGNARKIGLQSQYSYSHVEIDQLKDEVQTKGKDLEKANKVSVFPCHLPCVNPVGEYVHVHVYVHSHITHVQNSLHNAVSVVTECVII